MKVSVFHLILALLPSVSAGMTLETATQRYVSQSAQIKSANELLKASKADQWRRFLFNEPQFQYLRQDNGSSEVFGLSLPLAFPGKTFFLSRLDTVKESAQEGELSARTYESVKYIVQAYLDCASAREGLKNTEITVNDLQTVFSSLSMMYESGHSTQAERIGAELQLRQARSDLQANQDKAHTSCEKLAKILGDSADSLNELPIPEDLPKSVLQGLGSRTADAARAIPAVNLAQVNMDLASWSQIPDLNISYNLNHYFHDSQSPTADPWTTTYGISIVIPIFFPFHERVEIGRTRAQALSDKFTAELQLQQSEADESDAMREYLRSRARLDEIRKRDLTLAETLVQSTFSAYKSGKLGFSELMNSRKTLADLRNQEVQLRVSVINAHLRCLKKCDQ